MTREEIALVSLSAFMGTGVRVTVAYRRPDMFVDSRVCFAGELAADHPELPTFRAPELAEIVALGTKEAAAAVHAMKNVGGGRVDVARDRVLSLLNVPPTLSETDLQRAWNGWNKEERDVYNRLRMAANRWLGLDKDGSGLVADRMAAASWAADCVEARAAALLRKAS